MNCPRCGSEKIQFGTNTSGGGYSAQKGCCGYIIFGPLGLLCGALGSKIKSKEFWMCQNCGYKFTDADAQRAKQQILNAKITKSNQKPETSIQNDAKEEKSGEGENKTYSVVLLGTGNKTLESIKLVREITGCGLAEAKKIVENVPSNIKVCDSQEEAEYISNRFVSIGAFSEINEYSV